MFNSFEGNYSRLSSTSIISEESIILINLRIGQLGIKNKGVSRINGTYEDYLLKFQL